uniref:Uncharacterized protein n=1 Tax=Labrus bergylta TaxID=56723 RepID=A0A3Q3FHJ6_9LABR
MTSSEHVVRDITARQSGTPKQGLFSKQGLIPALQTEFRTDSPEQKTLSNWSKPIPSQYYNPVFVQSSK